MVPDISISLPEIGVLSAILAVISYILDIPLKLARLYRKIRGLEEDEAKERYVDSSKEIQKTYSDDIQGDLVSGDKIVYEDNPIEQRANENFPKGKEPNERVGFLGEEKAITANLMPRIREDFQEYLTWIAKEGYWRFLVYLREPEETERLEQKPDVLRWYEIFENLYQKGSLQQIAYPLVNYLQNPEPEEREKFCNFLEDLASDDLNLDYRFCGTKFSPLYVSRTYDISPHIVHIEEKIDKDSDIAIIGCRGGKNKERTSDVIEKLDSRSNVDFEVDSWYSGDMPGKDYKTHSVFLTDLKF